MPGCPDGNAIPISVARLRDRDIVAIAIVSYGGYQKSSHSGVSAEFLEGKRIGQVLEEAVLRFLPEELRTRDERGRI